MNDTEFPNRDVVLFGTGDVAEVITVYLERFSDLNIVAYTVDRDYLPDGDFFGKPVVAWDEIRSHYPPDKVRIMGPLTYQRLNTIRRDRYFEGKEWGYQFASFIHPASHVLTDKIGDHVIILEQNVVQPFAEIGDNVIMWSNNHIGHHATIKSHCFVASYVGIGGSTVVGEECYLAGQVACGHGLEVGDRCAILNGAFVQSNLPDDSVITGPSGEIKPFPSRRIKNLL